MASLHISISAEPVFHLGGFPVTNSGLTGIIVSLLLIIFTLVFFATKSTNLKSQNKLHLFIEMIIEALYNLTADIAGHQKARIFFPLIANSFIFILFNNWIGLLPGVGTIGILEESSSDQPESAQYLSSPPQALALAPETETEEQESETKTAATKEEPASHSEPKFVPLFRAATADLNTTLALAIISVSLTQFYGIKYLGLSYFKKFLNFSNPINTFVGLLDIVSEIAKIISFAFRLFGNIFAGEVLLAVIAYLIPLLLPLPFVALEIFVGLIQALVFSMLTLVFINMATISHDH